MPTRRRAEPDDELPRFRRRLDAIDDILNPVAAGELALELYDELEAPREQGRKSGRTRRIRAASLLREVETIKAKGLTDKAASRVYLARNDDDWPRYTADEQERKISNLAQVVSNARGR